MVSERIDALQATAVVSVFASLIVIATPLLFPSMATRQFMRIVAFISIGDVIGNFPYMFPYRPHTGNWWCTLQALMNLCGYPAGWLWTVVLVFLLYRLATSGTLPRSMWLAHVVCWGLPVFLALLSLAFSNFTSNPTPFDVCVENTKRDAQIYHGVAYYGLLFSCLVIMLALFLKIQSLQMKKDINVTSASFKVAKSALLWYPTILIVFWMPHALTATHYHDSEVYFICLNIKILHGLATAIVFLAQSRESQRLWLLHVVSPVFRCFCLKGRDNQRNASNSATYDLPITRSSSMDIGSVDDILDHSLILSPDELLRAAAASGYTHSYPNPVLVGHQAGNHNSTHPQHPKSGSISLKPVRPSETERDSDYQVS